VLADAIVSGYFSNSSILLHLERALQRLQQDSARHNLLLSLVEFMPLLRVGCLTWAGPGELEKLKQQPIRWGSA
jgi:hypothetical protein